MASAPLPRHRSDLGLHTGRGLRAQRHREGRLRPDATLAPRGSFTGQGEWADPAPVLMVVEITSDDADTDRRAREDKPRAFAETGVPVYLLIDRDRREARVRSEPDGARYKWTVTVAFGRSVGLPEPVGLELDTGSWKQWVR